MALSINKEIMSTINLIRELWPQFLFTKEDVAEGRLDFIIRFYSTFVVDLKDRISFLLNEDAIVDEFESIQDRDIQVVLYCKVANICRKMNYYTINLADFYFQNPRKMYLFIKFSIHLMAVLNNSLDEMFVVVNDKSQKVAEYENLENVKQELLEESAEYAKNLALSQDAFEKLVRKMEKVTKLEEKMLKEKLVQEQNYAVRTTEKIQLQKENDNSEYEFKLLEDRVSELQECVITESDYAKLRNTEKYLEIEYQQLCKFDMDENIDKEMEVVKYFEEYAKTIGELTSDCLSVETWHDLNLQDKLNQDVFKKTSNESSLLTNDINNLEKNIEKVEQTLQEIQLIGLELEKKHAMEEQIEQGRYEKQLAIYSSNFEEYRKCEAEIICNQMEIQESERNENTFITHLTQEKEKMLSRHKEAVNKFRNKLLSIKRHNEEFSLLLK